jgi:hypothetical protein
VLVAVLVLVLVAVLVAIPVATVMVMAVAVGVLGGWRGPGPGHPLVAVCPAGAVADDGLARVWTADDRLDAWR